MQGVPFFKPYPMQSIDFSRTFYLIDEQVRAYNEDKPIREQLRTGHVTLLREIVKIWAAQTNKTRLISGGIMPLLTCNTQLANRVGVTTKTIYNYIERLKRAKTSEGNSFVVKKWNGSHKSRYRITLPVEILSLHHTIDTILAVSGDEIAVRAAIDSQTVSPGERKSLLHTETHKPTNTVNRAVDNAIASSGLMTLSGDETKQANSEQPNKPSSAINPANFATLFAIVAELWRWIEPHLYHRLDYVSNTQRVEGMAHLMRYFDCKPSLFRYRKIEIFARLKMVESWLNARPDRFIPIPATYFDPDNSKGFSATGKWAEKSIERTIQLEKYKKAYRLDMQANKAFRQYVRQYAEQPNDLKLYLQICNKIGRKDAKMLEAFNKIVAAINQAA